VTHVGTGHRLASGIIEQRRDSPADYVLIDAPDDQGAWGDWLAAGARRLNAAVGDLGFGATVWTWQPKHQTAGFWQRRMLHDLIIHRFDGEDGNGKPDLASDLAADGVADILLALEVFPRLAGEDETLQFTATDTGEGWHVTLTPSGLRWRPGEGAAGEGAAGATVAAPVAELLLILNRRREAARVDGDTTLYQRFRDGSRF
jgi:hypothetical protein